MNDDDGDDVDDDDTGGGVLPCFDEKYQPAKSPKLRIIYRFVRKIGKPDGESLSFVITQSS